MDISYLASEDMRLVYFGAGHAVLLIGALFYSKKPARKRAQDFVDDVRWYMKKDKEI